jgi:hypothetical protein
MAALRDVQEADLSDPEFLSTLVEVGYTLTLRPGEVVRQDLRAGGHQYSMPASGPMRR